MINMIHLSRDQPTVMVNAVNVFTKIKAIDASLIEGAFDPQTKPFINLRLFNDFNVITFHINLIPASNKFNCYDVLQAANQVQNLRNVSFNKLIIEVTPKIFFAEYSIRMQIDIQDE
jgi:predicted nucleic acid-binding protein